MAQYLIGEVERLTGIKAHVLRYWEEVIPCFAPQKDLNGRRLYSQREIELILRLRYLINTKGYTIEGARRQLIQEAANADTAEVQAATLKTLREIRAQLGEMYLMLRKSGESYAKAKQEHADGKDS
ncbi:MAG: MerR family transcriptional regulator [Treponema sp.]|jgi:DNA-binding transcriptional MerR regulator|nr:MerR family transcriptional regulator [Treponema sp.]